MWCQIVSLFWVFPEWSFLGLHPRCAKEEGWGPGGRGTGTKQMTPSAFVSPFSPAICFWFCWLCFPLHTFECLLCIFPVAILSGAFVCVRVPVYWCFESSAVTFECFRVFGRFCGSFCGACMFYVKLSSKYTHVHLYLIILSVALVAFRKLSTGFSLGMVPLIVCLWRTLILYSLQQHRTFGIFHVFHGISPMHIRPTFN